MELIVTDSIQLKSLTSRDAAIFYKSIVENRSHLRQWISWVYQVKSEEDAYHFLYEMEEQWRIQKCLLNGVFYQNELIGCIEMQNWDQELKKANVGYWLIQKAQGKGFMYAVGQRFLSYLFHNLNLNKVELWHVPENERSAALAKRLGFKIEGVLRDNFLHNGHFCDLVIQGLLRKEFEER